eukprot:4550078-Pyramimonas_sp.AAC.1
MGDGGTGAPPACSCVTAPWRTCSRSGTGGFTAPFACALNRGTPSTSCTYSYRKRPAGARSECLRELRTNTSGPLPPV